MTISAKSESKERPDEDGRTNTREKAKAMLQRWVELTTLHGVIDAFRTDVPMWAKVIWRLVLPIVLMLSVYQTTMVVQSHFNTPMWSSTSYIDPDTESDTVRMPTVTVCSNNKMNYTKFMRYGVDAASVLPAMFQSMVGYKGWFQMRANGSAVPEPGPVNLNNSDSNETESNRQMAGMWFTCDDIVLQIVRWDRTACNSRRFYEPTVCTDDLQAQWLRMYNDFDLFNSYPACCQITLTHGYDAVHSAGATDSLTIILVDEQQAYLPVLMNNLNEPGFSVHFNYGPIIDTSGFMPVSPGWMTKAILVPQSSQLNPRNVIDTLFGTKPPCATDTPTMLYYNSSQYAISTCEHDCLFQEQVRLCQCEPDSLAERRRLADNSSSPPPTARPCSDHQFLACEARAGAESSVIEQSAERKQCKKKCLPLCNTTSVTIGTSVSKILPGEQAAMAGKVWRLNATKPSAIRNSVAVLSVEFGSIQYTKTTIYLSGSVMSLLSTVGGSISLWLGASMLTLLQIILALTNMLAALVANRQRTT